MIKKMLVDRVLKLEAAAKPKQILFIYTPKDHPFPIEIDMENLPRRFAWGPVLDEWSDRHVAEAVANIDWSKYAEYFVISMSDAITPKGREAHFWRKVDEAFTKEDYLRELAEATAWTSRNGYSKPRNYLDDQPITLEQQP